MQLAGWEQQGNSPFMLTLFALRAIVSVGYIYLCRTKNTRFKGVQTECVQVQSALPLPVQPSFTLDDIRAVVLEIIAQANASEQQGVQNVQPLQLLQRTRRTKKQVEVSVTEEESESEEPPENFQRVQAYLANTPDATVRDVAGALEISLTTANKWMHRVRHTN